MNEKPLFQELYQEETLFPFAWKKMTDPLPCCFRTDAPDTPVRLGMRPELLRAFGPAELYAHLTGEGSYPLQFHLHDHCQITQCLSGKVVYLFESDATALLPGDILLINAMTPHTWVVVEPDTSRYQLGYYPEALSANTYNQCFLPYFRLLYSQHYASLCLREGDDGFDRASQCVAEIERAYQRKGFAFDAMIHDSLFDLSAHLLLTILDERQLEADMGQRDRTIQKALGYIDEHIGDALSMPAVAGHVGLNPSYFSVYFKKHLGVSYKKYVLTQRVTRAAHLLQYSDATVAQILFECGFSSVSSFYQAFHRVYTMSPAQFRKLMTHRMPGRP